LDDDIPYRAVEIEEIDLDSLVGVCRWDADQCKNWINVLNSLHKMRNFMIYDKESFQEIITNPPTHNIQPQVVEIDGELYIDGDGKHRLTMAKCLGLKKSTVLVKHLQ
jgi:hypothetical protein